jgi:signal transduction histidine kinase
MISRLDDAFQQSKRFVADASHELRTPLTVLRSELESLAQNPLGG